MAVLNHINLIQKGLLVVCCLLFIPSACLVDGCERGM